MGSKLNKNILRELDLDPKRNVVNGCITIGSKFF
jgi:hypothetical protein